jgi:hypothetical protein
VRNPLATFNSFITTMVNKNIEGLGNEHIRNDLLFGYKLLYEGYINSPKNSILVKYENIIKNPKKEIINICNYIGVEFEETMLNYKPKIGVLQGKLVDPKSIHKHDGPVNNYIDQWKNGLNTKQKKLLAKGFIENMGKSLITKIGYSYDDLSDYVKDIKSNEQKSLKYIQWNDLMSHPSKKSLLTINKLYIAKKLSNRQYVQLLIFFFKHPIAFLRICKYIIQR